MSEHAPLMINRLGHEGDGLVETTAGTIAVAGALPGDRISIDADGRPTLVARIGPGRAEPSCAHFGSCGGCVAQHMAPPTYTAWKTEILTTALARQGLVVPIDAVVGVEPGSRRRLVLSAARAPDGQTTLGFHARRSDSIVPVAECPVAAPAIVTKLPALRDLAAKLLHPREEIRITVTAAIQGLDVAVTKSGRAPALPAGLRRDLIARCEEAGIVRLTLNDDTITTLAEPTIETAGGALFFPPGAFVQAVPAAEQAIARLIAAGIGKARTAADLFCGVGTFTTTIAARARTLAVDDDRAAIEALQRSARHLRGARPIETKVRNLLTEPLSAMELADVQAVVLDPPRAGAKAQCEALVRSRVPRVVMVSCNPATFARDLSILAGGGYVLTRVTPIDQFLWSSHLEAVAVLQRRG